MIPYAQGLALLKKYISDEKRIRHSEGVAEIAFRTATKIKTKYPKQKVNPEKVRLAGLLHDIGYGIPTGHHEINSVEILQKEGMSDIADIVLHGYVYEIHLLEGIDEKAYLPTTLENKIVIFADLVCDHNQEITDIKERILEIQHRKKHDIDRVLALKMAEFRLLRIENEIYDLLGGGK
ncbi:HD domain-containing protein [Candidatus Gracilibacteria bacterium]|nr:HD domain-containing protein [Candidatus Gracilibacteria bacterium]